MKKCLIWLLSCNACIAFLKLVKSGNATCISLRESELHIFDRKIKKSFYRLRGSVIQPSNPWNPIFSGNFFKLNPCQEWISEHTVATRTPTHGACMEWGIPHEWAPLRAELRSDPVNLGWARNHREWVCGNAPHPYLPINPPSSLYFSPHAAKNRIPFIRPYNALVSGYVIRWFQTHNFILFMVGWWFASKCFLKPEDSMFWVINWWIIF